MNHIQLTNLTQRRGWLLLSVLPLMLVLALVLPILAQSGGDYELVRSTTSGSSSVSAGGDYTLGGIVGQTEGGSIAGGQYALVGGFGAGGSTAPPAHPMYLPMTLK